jgi:2-polyprenyl-3-methyl-5-hydroxy-6-metoxy-1,4-benzoquinol methylase
MGRQPAAEQVNGSRTVDENAFAKVEIGRVQAYWDRRPCNIRHSPVAVGTREYFDQVERRKYFVEPHIPGFAEFDKWRGKHVLEIGCGIGTDTINFARAGARVTALDLSGESLKLAGARAELFGLREQIQFCQGDAEDLGAIVPKRPFDLVYSFGVIHHTPHPQRVVMQIPNYLHRDSELRIMLYSKISYKLFWVMREENAWDMSRIDELIARASEAQTGCPVTYTYTFDQVRRLLEGFQILDIRKAHIFTWDIDAYKRYEYRKDAAWINVSDERLAELEEELGWHTLVRAKFSG